MNNKKLNWLRAGVLGANDGIISVSVVLVSMAGILNPTTLLFVGLAAIAAGAFSMAIGEYISVSTQKDAEESAKYEELTNPFHAAWSSFLAFITGAIIPLIATIIFASPIAVIIAALIALALTAFISSWFGQSKWQKPLARNLIGGGIALTAGILFNVLFAI